MTTNIPVMPSREPDYVRGKFLFWFEEMIAEQRKIHNNEHFRSYRIVEEGDGRISCVFWSGNHTIGELNMHVQHAWYRWKCNKIAEEVLLGSND